MTPPARVRTLVVDDEPLARKRLITLLADLPDIAVIGEAGSGSAAVEAIAAKRPDLVLLDVQMPGLDGFGVLRCTAGAHVPVVVFVTAHDEHAIRAFEVQAVDYLLKPVATPRFHEAVRRAVAKVRSGLAADRARTIEAVLAQVGAPADDARIPIRQEGEVVLVRPADIDWVEADGDHLRIHAGRELYVVRETLTELEGRLPADRFARIHRSVIVNRGRVRVIESVPKGGYVLVLDGGTRVRSGRSYRETVQAILHR